MLMSCAADLPAYDMLADVTFTDHVHVIPVPDAPGNTPIAAAAPAVVPDGAHLTYHGGKVIQDVRVTQVLYGPGNYIPELTSTDGVSMASAYTQMLTSGVFDWLDEYNTSSPAQAIGRGSFAGSVQITPADSRNGSAITDANIQAELAAQIRAGELPPPSDDQLYMLHFPAGKSLFDPRGMPSCVPNGFCGYHGTFKIGSQNVYYGVLPSLADGACARCAFPTPFEGQQSTASHALIEAITDAEAGLATTLGPPIAWEDHDPANHLQAEIGDLCDGHTDTFMGTDGNTYTIRQEFSNQQNQCITTRVPATPAASRTSDILWQDTNGALSIWFMAGATISSQQDVAMTLGPEWQIQGAGDFNGDGKSDILWRHSTDGAVSIWLMSGETLLDQQFPTVLAGFDWQIQGTGDFDGDGKSDILWRSATGVVDIWTMSGGTILSQTFLSVASVSDWQIQGTGDFDGDGKSDILWRSGDGATQIWTMWGGAIYSQQLTSAELTPDWQIRGIGDFNGDGKTDILWQNVNGATEIWLMSGATILSRQRPSATQGPEWQIHGTGDFDGDGKADILWRNTTGAVAIWLMSGGTIASQRYPFVVRGPAWQIKRVSNFDQ